MTATATVTKQGLNLRVPAAITVALTVLVVAVAAGVGWRAVVVAVWAVPVVLAAVEDAYTARLRDAVVVRGAIAAAVTITVVTFIEADRAIAIGALAAAAGLAGWLLIFHLVSPTGMGFGDVKFAALLGLGVGALTPIAAVLVAVVAVALQVVVVVARPLPAQRRSVVGRWEAPFGPALAVASILVVGLVARGGGW